MCPQVETFLSSISGVLATIVSILTAALSTKGQMY